MNLADGPVRNFAGSKSEDAPSSTDFLRLGGVLPSNHGRESDHQRFSASGNHSWGIPSRWLRRQIAFTSSRFQSKSRPCVITHSLRAASAIRELCRSWRIGGLDPLIDEALGGE